MSDRVQDDEEVDPEVDVRHVKFLRQKRVDFLKKRNAEYTTPVDQPRLTNYTSLSFTGYTIYTFPDGMVYSGQWTNGMRVGLGVQVWKDGSSFRGQFAGDKINGTGLYTYSTNNTYIGDFVDNKREGVGKYIWANSGEWYIGEWQDDLRSGVGTHYWDDGALYQGRWKNGTQDGYGFFTWPDGRIYAGGVQKGKRHGLGVITNLRGEELPSKWNQGVPVANLSFTASVAFVKAAAIMASNEARILYSVAPIIFMHGNTQAKEAQEMVTRWKDLVQQHPQSVDKIRRPTIAEDVQWGKKGKAALGEGGSGEAARSEEKKAPGKPVHEQAPKVEALEVDHDAAATTSAEEPVGGNNISPNEEAPEGEQGRKEDKGGVKLGAANGVHSVSKNELEMDAQSNHSRSSINTRNLEEEYPEYPESENFDDGEKSDYTASSIRSASITGKSRKSSGEPSEVLEAESVYSEALSPASEYSDAMTRTSLGSAAISRSTIADQFTQEQGQVIPRKSKKEGRNRLSGRF